MPKFGRRSKEKLDTLHPDLQKVLNEAIKHVDFSILEGHRDQATQDMYYEQGKSKLKYPNGKHNTIPSKAVDIAPYFKNAPHIRWDDARAFTHLAGVIMGIGYSMGVKLRWGGNWDMDDEFGDQTFNDLPHLELL
jgi:peptidoglycan L-alanyl-D-glutamate endopeptidase CwlK